MQLKRVWYRQVWICGGLWLLLLLGGALVAKHWLLPAGIALMVLGFAIVICSILFAFVKLRCPHCGWSVSIGIANHPDGGFYCPKCGGIIHLA